MALWLPSCAAFWDLYEEVRPLGRGFYGAVLLVRSRATGLSPSLAGYLAGAKGPRSHG